MLMLGCSKDSDPVTPTPTQTVKYTLTITAGEGGTVNSSGGQYDSGTSVSVTATPNKYFKFEVFVRGSSN